MRIRDKVLVLLMIGLVVFPVLAVDQETIQMIESRVYEAKVNLKDIDYQTIESLLQNIKEGIYNNEDLATIENLLVESLKIETRAIWLDNISMSLLTSREKIVELMDLLSDININLILADIFGNGHSVFPSKVAEQREVFRHIPQGDMVPIMIEEAHKRGIEFHGLASLFGFDATGMTPYIEKLEWFDRTANGGFLTEVVDFEAFMSPVIPEVCQFFLEVIKEMASYELDGIHLDYIRYGRNLGYHPIALDLYRTVGGDPDNLSNPKELDNFLKFKASFITSFVDEVRREIQAINPRLLLSVAVASPLEYAQREIGQDWKDWADKKLVHMIFHMCYVNTSDKYKTVIDWDTTPIRNSAVSFPGIGLYIIDELELQSQIEVGQNKPVSGQAVFSTIHLTSEKAQVLKNGVYREPAMPTYRDPQKAASAIIENLAKRIEKIGPEIGIDSELNLQIVRELLELEAEIRGCTLRPWDSRDLHEGSKDEYDQLQVVLAKFKSLKKTLRDLPRQTITRALNDLLKAERLVQVLCYYSEP